jgi:hypothetical protein
MKPQAQRLFLTAILFAGWLGYLAHLVMCRPHTPDGLRGAFEGRPVTLSRPQFLVSTLDVVAEVSGDKGEKVVVKEVLFPKNNSPVEAEQTIHVANIDQCHPVGDPVARDVTPPPDYNGPGKYLLPLQPADKEDGHHYQVVPTPPSPGFPSPSGVSVGPPRIYPYTQEIRAEYQEIGKP